MCSRMTVCMCTQSFLSGARRSEFSETGPLPSSSAMGLSLQATLDCTQGPVSAPPWPPAAALLLKAATAKLSQRPPGCRCHPCCVCVPSWPGHADSPSTILPKQGRPRPWLRLPGQGNAVFFRPSLRHSDPNSRNFKNKYQRQAETTGPHWRPPRVRRKMRPLVARLYAPGHPSHTPPGLS